MADFEQTYTSDTSISIPDNCRNVFITVYGAPGGNGYADTNGGGGKGFGRVGEFTLPDFTAYEIGIEVGQPGSNGNIPTGGNGGVGFTSAADGGAGGTGGTGIYYFTYQCGTNCNGCQQGCRPGCCYDCGGGFNCCFNPCCSTSPVNCNGSSNRGGGGGGGGVVGLNVDGVRAVAAGGGGGGRGTRGTTNGANAAAWTATTSSIVLTSGSNGFNSGNSGGTGGGGGSAGTSTSAKNYTQAAGSYYRSDVITLSDSAPGGVDLWNAQSQILVKYDIGFPEFTSITYPAELLSGTGTPEYTATISWQAINYQVVTLTGPGVNYTATQSNDSYTVTLPQSVVGTTSPACNTYVLTASAGSATVTENITICAYNDNTPSNITPAATASGAGGPRPLTALEKDTTYTLFIDFGGVDMPVICQPATSGVRISDNGTNWYSGAKLIPVGGDLFVEFDSLDYNTSTTPGGTNAAGETIGQTNTRTITIQIGTSSYTFNATTRAPVIEETFDTNLVVDSYPYPDVDVVPAEPNTEQYQITPELVLDDIEIPVEIKASDPDQQIRRNGGAWQNMREI